MKKLNLNPRVLLASAVAGMAAMAPAVHAAAIDVTALKTDIEAQATPIATVGGAVLLIVIGIKAFLWVRAAMR